MVHTCVVWGCTNRADPDTTKRQYFNIPKVINHQGTKTERLSTERRNLWLARINRDGFNPEMASTQIQTKTTIKCVLTISSQEGKQICMTALTRTGRHLRKWDQSNPSAAQLQIRSLPRKGTNALRKDSIR
ncbi:uncharacterized protein LOC117341219 [Pecten maximus]|uniref:uncharacterized protein LOC117341219 n=1 Tax=Pecten maximus TaxID=6579 RepID=UPI0014590B13|nr:uncharacterized protein LOC117341219 [Pecten maximus]